VPETVALRAPPVVGLVGALHPCLLAGNLSGRPTRTFAGARNRQRTRRAQQAAPGQPIRLGAAAVIRQGRAAITTKSAKRPSNSAKSAKNSRICPLRGA
jgi:hypothetical protein